MSIQKLENKMLMFAAGICLLGGVIHLAIPFGGPTWYRFFGAPESLAQMAELEMWYPVINCMVIASVLLVWSAYAFSAAGYLISLPFLPGILLLIAIILIARGLLFIPIMFFLPELLSGITHIKTVNFFIVSTSLLCLVIGSAFAMGYRKVCRARR